MALIIKIKNLIKQRLVPLKMIKTKSRQLKKTKLIKRLMLILETKINKKYLLYPKTIFKLSQIISDHQYQPIKGRK